MIANSWPAATGRLATETGWGDRQAVITAKINFVDLRRGGNAPLPA
jgi:hypothetical protein